MGRFNPFEPVNCQDQEHVVITVENAGTAEENLLDAEFLRYCETQGDDSVSLEEVRQALAKIPGCIANDVQDERDQG